ncbi:MAG: DUF1259 domain-containing protein [Acidobacteria bacterium]|nr:DUF1259 domain-containing protein [Acidobacteriota bacterium]
MVPQNNMTRRSALFLAAAAAGAALTPSALATPPSASDHQFSPPPADVQHDLDAILQAKGKVSDGIYSIGIDRNDITDVTLNGVSITPAFALGGGLYFQQNSDGTATMNGDFCFKANELNPVIKTLIQHDIFVQAEHQHMYDFTPIVWFLHFRAHGDARRIAKGFKAALATTSTPFPQTGPSKPPTSPLPADQIGKILGAKPSIHSGGVVKFNVPRAEQITLGGVPVSPYLNVAAPIAFMPHGGGQNAACIPDFGMIASEINPVIGLMQNHGWDIGCLYNQETDEHPQLYFSHQFKTGDAIQLAHEVRAGLNLTNSKFKSS